MKYKLKSKCFICNKTLYYIIYKKRNTLKPSVLNFTQYKNKFICLTCDLLKKKFKENEYNKYNINSKSV